MCSFDLSFQKSSYDFDINHDYYLFAYKPTQNWYKIKMA